MAMEAFAIVERRVKLDVFGLRDFAEILHPYVMDPAPLRLVIAEHRVVGMAGEARMIARHKVVLKMRGASVVACKK